MSEPMTVVEYDKWIRATYLILFDPKPNLPPDELEETRQQLYDLRRLIPDVLSIHIEENVVKAPQGTPFACIIGYLNKWKLNEFTSHPAFLKAYQRLEENSRHITSFGAELLDAPVQHSIREATPLETRQTMSTQERLRLIVRDQMQVAESHITATTKWMEDLGAEEVDLAMMWWAIEEEFGVSLDGVMFESIQEAEEWLTKKKH